MTAALVGHSGFVGGNLLRQRSFDACFASRDIDAIVGRRFDLLVISAVPAQMWLANHHPERDLANILSLYERLSRVEADRAVLISTIAVYADPASRPDENSADGYETEKAYGRHRRLFEEKIAALFPRLLTVRLPALFGPGLSKNFIFDLLHPIPSFLPSARMADLKSALPEAEWSLIEAAFESDPKTDLFRFRREAPRDPEEEQAIASILDRHGIAARNFTNSRSRFQFYNLDRLWSDIERGLAADLAMLNLATEPLLAADVAYRLTGKSFENDSAPRVDQDMRSRHAALWGRPDGYLRGGEEVLGDLERFHGQALRDGRQ